MREMVALLARGGPVMIPLAGCSILALAVVLEGGWTWWRVGSTRDGDAVLTEAARGDWARGVPAAGIRRHRSSAAIPPTRSPLALRVGAPILASDEALAHACPADPELQAQTVRRWLDQLRPTDFEDHGTRTE